MNERSGMTCLSEHGDFVCRLGKGHEGEHRSGLVTWPTTAHIESLALEAYTQIGNCGCLPGPSHALCPRCELLRDMLTALAAAYPDYDDVGPDDEYRGQ